MKSDLFGAGRCVSRRFCLLAAALAIVSGAFCPGQANSEEGEPNDPRPVLLSLASKALGEEGGEGEEAQAIVERLLAAAPLAMDATFRDEVEAASPVEAARILGLTLLRSGQADLRENGLAFLGKAVAGESVLAMEVLAQIQLEGAFGQEQSIDEAVELLKRARQLPGATEAHRILGDLALAGTGMARDPVIAIEYYRQGAAAGAVSCLLALHRLFREKDFEFQDLVEAERYGRSAAESGNLEAMVELASFFETHAEGAPQWLRAAEWLGKAVERGATAAALRLADYHFEGRLGAVNGDEGMRLLRRAAAAGSGEACFRIAEAYQSGRHLPQDPVASTAWHRIGAELGWGAAENAYGMALATGFGTRAEPAEAIAWFRRASEKGVSDAFVNLGELHEHGVGVEKDPVGAAGFYRTAAEAGSAIGQEKLARLISSQGSVAAEDPLEAAYWAARAAASGRGDAKDLAERLQNGLTPDLQEQLKRRLEAAASP